MKTGDTILNIRGAVRDAIGDAGAAPGPRASSRLDTFVIRPAQAQQQRKPQHDQPPQLVLQQVIYITSARSTWNSAHIEYVILPLVPHLTSVLVR